MKLRRSKIFIVCRIAGRVIPACAALFLLLFQASCQLAAMPAVLGTPTPSEAKSNAEFNLAEQEGQKILVLVEQPVYLNAYPGLRFFLTDMITKTLQQRVKIAPELFTDYDALSSFRSETYDFSLLAPEQVGSALGADFVLLVVVTDYQFSKVGDTDFSNGMLDVQASLIKVATGERVWPAVEQARVVQVGFESQRHSPDTAAVKLTAAAAHCVTRYLYDCPKKQFKILEERADIGWDE